MATHQCNFSVDSWPQPLNVSGLMKEWSNCTPNVTRNQTVETSFGDFGRSALMLLAICIALMGNFFIIFSFCKNFKMRTITNTLVVNLCAADLLSSICDVPFWLSTLLEKPIYGNTILCRLLLVFEDLFQIVALLTMCGIAIDRFITLVKGLRRLMTHQRARMLILWSWIQGGISAAPWDLIKATSRRCISFPHFYEPAIAYEVVNAFFKVASIVLPFVTTYYVFYRIIKAARGRGKVNIDTSYVSRNYSAERFAVDAYKRSSKTAIILFVMFFICSFPYLCVILWSLAGPSGIQFNAGFFVYFIFTLKRSLFPAIYIFRNRVIWSFIHETLTCSICRGSGSMRQQDSLSYIGDPHQSCFAIFGRHFHRSRIHPSVYDGENNYFPPNLEVCFVSNGKEVKPLTDHFTDIAKAEREKGGK